MELTSAASEQNLSHQFLDNGVDECSALGAQSVDAENPRNGRRQRFLEHPKLILNEI
jgi:hypothetical protein